VSVGGCECRRMCGLKDRRAWNIVGDISDW
jgi:hypothetical protein